MIPTLGESSINYEIWVNAMFINKFPIFIQSWGLRSRLAAVPVLIRFALLPHLATWTLQWHPANLFPGPGHLRPQMGPLIREHCQGRLDGIIGRGKRRWLKEHRIIPLEGWWVCYGDKISTGQNIEKLLNNHVIRPQQTHHASGWSVITW
jgi:hypothetical protein